MSLLPLLSLARLVTPVGVPVAAPVEGRSAFRSWPVDGPVENGTERVRRPLAITTYMTIAPDITNVVGGVKGFSAILLSPQADHGIREKGVLDVTPSRFVRSV